MRGLAPTSLISCHAIEPQWISVLMSIESRIYNIPATRSVGSMQSVQLLEQSEFSCVGFKLVSTKQHLTLAMLHKMCVSMLSDIIKLFVLMLTT